MSMFFTCMLDGLIATSIGIGIIIYFVVVFIILMYAFTLINEGVTEYCLSIKRRIIDCIVGCIIIIATISFNVGMFIYIFKIC